MKSILRNWKDSVIDLNKSIIIIDFDDLNDLLFFFFCSKSGFVPAKDLPIIVKEFPDLVELLVEFYQGKRS